MRVLRVMGSFTLFVAVGCGDREPTRPPDHVLVDVTVIDGTGAAPQPARTIEITDGRITALRPTVAGDSATVDVAGSFVTPGLIDAHVHLPVDRELLRTALDSMLSLGITSTREMASSPGHAQFLSECRFDPVHAGVSDGLLGGSDVHERRPSGSRGLRRGRPGSRGCWP
jgi:hypothetical protein